MDISDLESFANAYTMAQACSQVWRKNHMPKTSEAINPPEGYPNQKKYSTKAVRWIKAWLERTSSKFGTL